MNSSVNNLTIQVQIKTPNWLKRSVIYFPNEMLSFFPSDALGDRDANDSASKPRRALPVTFDYGAVQCECDIAVERNKQGKVTRIKPRESVPKDFFQCAVVGDYVTITKVNPRLFEIRLVKTNGTTI